MRGRNKRRAKYNYILKKRKDIKKGLKKIKRYNKVYKKTTYVEEIKENFRYKNTTIYFLEKENFFKKKEKPEKKGKDIIITMPSKFSLIENPDEVFAILAEILSYKDYDNKSIYFDYSKTKILELGAVSLKNKICLDLRNEGFTFSGNFPGRKADYIGDNIPDGYQEATEIFIFSGLYNILGLDPKKDFDYEGEPVNLKMMSGGNKRNTLFEKIKLGEIEHSISEYLNNALKISCSRELTAEGTRYFDKIIGEVLDNCHQHCGEHEEYYCAGHHYQIEKRLGKFQLSLFNFGQTIAHGLEHPKNILDEIKVRIEELINLHSKKFFGFMNTDWDREALLTLYALQNKVSRAYKDGINRGTGTIRMLQAFQALGDSYNSECNPTMSIISGSTQILIDNSDICKLSNNKQITFNDKQTLEIPPSSKHVKKIKNFFPGTIISIVIYLDEKWLDEKEANSK